jgi:predicted DNA-binding transcriptional regulator AlpA
VKLKRAVLYDVKQVALLWDLNWQSVYRAAREGRLPVAPLKVGSSLRWPRAAVNASVGLADDADPFDSDSSAPEESSTA